MVRAKFKLNSVETFESGQAKLNFSAVCQDETPEDARYHRYTPFGELKMTVDNPKALEQFKPGKHYYLDFIGAD